MATSIGYAVLGATVAFGVAEKQAHTLICFLVAVVLIVIGWFEEGAG